MAPQTLPGAFDHLRQLRRLLDVTQADVARRAGISPSMLGAVERRERKPSEAVAQRVRRALSELTAESRP
jgi:transcriptional regulator with XRE-family HTH domain